MGKKVKRIFASLALAAVLLPYTAVAADSPTAHVLIVGAGAGGYSGQNGYIGTGGGGGEVLYETSVAITGGTHIISVGSTTPTSHTIDVYPEDGGPSTAFGFSATGGVGGFWNHAGDSGSGQTHGVGSTASGAGDSGPGIDNNDTSAVNGGLGTFNSISGSSVMYGCGGWGYSASGHFADASCDTSYGNGGTGYFGGGGPDGSDGIVIIRFPTGDITVATSSDGVMTTDGDDTIYTFTHSGNFVVEGGDIPPTPGDNSGPSYQEWLFVNSVIIFILATSMWPRIFTLKKT